jgi:DNA polymerase-3 subunit beta
MKVSASAGGLADALALAKSLSDDPKIKQDNLRAALLVATDDALTITANVLDFAATLRVPATVDTPGAVAVAAAQLAGLAAGFADKAVVQITTDEAIAKVTSGRSRFKLTTVAPDCVPPMPLLLEETGRVELAREQAAALFERTAFAICKDHTRYYLAGILLHDTTAGLTGVATDGHRLARAVIPGTTGLSADHRLIVPVPAVKIITKLLRDRDIERLTLRRSKTLLAVETTKFVFISKLVDGTYPDYQRIVPEPSGNVATVERTALSQALERIAAVAQSEQRVVGLAWTADAPELRLMIDGADDVVPAEVEGDSKVAVAISGFAELIDEVPGARVRLDANGQAGPVLVTNPDNNDFTAIMTQACWPLAENAAA